MAETLEETSDLDADRQMDQQSFSCAQFEVFTHDYRERKEVPQCEDHGSHNGSCSDSSPTTAARKRIINTTRRLQKALLSLQRMPNSDVIKDMLDKMREISNELNEELKQQKSEFSTKTIPLPEFDKTDMELLLGDSEVPPSKTPFEEIVLFEKLEKEHLEALLFEADILLQEYDHIKHGIKA